MKSGTIFYETALVKCSMGLLKRGLEYSRGGELFDS
jgi:hypothetical protein